jgi:hypothetical protein
MFVDFRKTFFPTEKEKQSLRQFVQDMINENYEREGANCLNCTHSKYVYVNQYYDYTSCKLDNKLEIPNGLGCKHKCNNWRFKK